MIARDKENEILQFAINALKEQFALDNVEVNTEQIQNQNVRADYLLRIKVQQIEYYYYAEVKTNITKTEIAIKGLEQKMYELNKTPKYPVLLLTKYVNPKMAERLKNQGIQFIDTAGNAYINHPPLYIFVKGNRLTEALRPIPVKRAFKPTGLKLIFAFLCNPGLENKPYREIATIANVALGTVGWVMRDLRELGYMLDMGKRGYKLVEKEKLFERWIVDYPEKLRPKLILGRYRGEPGWWEQTNLNPHHAQWGGEVATARLTQYLKPQDATLYIDPTQLTQILMDNRLRKDPKGETEILERFWKPQRNQLNEETVPPLLIYADLIGTDNERNIETAKIIYEHHIIRLIRKD
jgi:hypothetical protein